MYEEPTCCAGTGIQVLVAAPDGCIDVPGMQLQRYVADRVCEVPDYEDGVRMSKGGDGGDVEELAGVILDSGEEDEGCCGSMFFDDGEDVFCCQG